MYFRESLNTDNTSTDSTNTENQKLITLGKCSRFYLLILGSGLCKLLSLFLVGTKNISVKGFGLFGFCATFIDYNFIQSILIYLGYIIFGIIFLFCKDVKKVEIKESIRKKTIINRNINDSKTYKEKIKNNRIQLFLLGLTLAFHTEIRKVLYIEGFQFFHFWTVEILFILRFMRKYFIMDFYFHHKVSIIFIISTCTILLLTASFLPNSLYDKNTGNAYKNIEVKLGSKFYSILFIFIFIALSFIYSFTRVYSKILMQIKFISPYKIIIMFGIIGFIISLIASIVSYKIDYKDNFYNYFSAMREVLNGEKPYKFWVEIFCIYPLFIFIDFLEITFRIFTIYYLNPIYVLLKDNIYFSITKLITFLFNISNDRLKIAHFLIAFLAEFLSALGYLVYLEIIELNFCGLNKYIKRRLMQKGEREFNKLNVSNIIDKDSINSDENTDKESEQGDNLSQYRNI